MPGLTSTSHFANGKCCRETFLGKLRRNLASGSHFVNRYKQEWLFIIEGSMTVGVALMLLPLLTDYPLQSKHHFLSRKLQLYAVSEHRDLGPNLKHCTGLADCNDLIGMADQERERRNC